MTVILRAFFAMSVMLLALLALSVPFIHLGTASFTVALLSAVMLGTVLAVSTVCISVDWDPFEELLS